MAPSAVTNESQNSQPEARDAMKAVSPRPAPPTFTSKLHEREYLKFRLAQAFRIFGQFARYGLAF